MAAAGLCHSPLQGLACGNLQTREARRAGDGDGRPFSAVTRRVNGPKPNFSTKRTARICVPRASAQNRRGFGDPKSKLPPKKKAPETEILQVETKPANEDKSYRPEEEDEDDSVPEVVTNRMLKRISFAVGIPLAVGLSFFPLFYWLKVVQHVDLPEWVPLFASVTAFGTAGFGISYGILSTSWDPRREGTLLGFKEAKVNWPVFLESIGKKD